jgi:hypothetical protein
VSGEAFSIIVRYWHDVQQPDSIHVRLIRVDTGEAVHLSDGVFLLRLTSEENTGVERCLIRHLISGREAYVQGGASLRTFIKECVLNSDRPDAFEPDKPEE